MACCESSNRDSVQAVDAYPALDLALTEVPMTPELGEREGVPWWHWDPSAWRRNAWKWSEYRVRQAKQKREAATLLGNSTIPARHTDKLTARDALAKCQIQFKRGELFKQSEWPNSLCHEVSSCDKACLPLSRAGRDEGATEHRFGCARQSLGEEEANVDKRKLH